MNDLSSPDATLTYAESLLLQPYSLDREALQGVFARLGAHRLDDADLYFQYARSEGWSLDEGIVKSGSFSIEQGVGVRAVSGEKTAFAYSDDLGMASLNAAADTVRGIGQVGGSGIVPLLRYPSTRHDLYSTQDPLLSLSAQDKVDLLLKLEHLTRSLDSRVVQVAASLGGQHEVILLARADGSLCADIRPLVRLSLSVIVEENGRREQGASGGGGRLDFSLFDDALLARYAQEAVHQATVNLNAQPAPAGEMTVVLGSGWPGILLHEAVGHGLEGDFNRKGSSVFSGKIGEQVAARGVTVVDDGTLADRRGSLNMDDEGCPTQRTVLIEDGVLKGYMQDSLNARLMGQSPTGNGRRESFACLPLPRMTNTLMLAGDKDPQEIIASVKKGLYAVNFGGGQVDITSGKFVFSMSEAYLIENGKVTAPVRGATLIGNGPEALKRVSMIGNDLALDPGVGTCGKDGQSVPVGVGQPTLRLNKLTVGGTH